VQQAQAIGSTTTSRHKNVPQATTPKRCQLDNQKKIKNEKVRVRAQHPEIKKPAKKDKETTADETRVNGGEKREAKCGATSCCGGSC
jgi:hypothetical protein